MQFVEFEMLEGVGQYEPVFNVGVSTSFFELHILRGSESSAPDAKDEKQRAFGGPADRSFLYQWHRSNGLDCQTTNTDPTLQRAPDLALMMNHDSFHAFTPANTNELVWAVQAQRD